MMLMTADGLASDEDESEEELVVVSITVPSRFYIDTMVEPHKSIDDNFLDSTFLNK